VANGDFLFLHLEADTILFSAYSKVRAGDYTGTVVIDSEDINVYVQPAYVAQQLRGDLIIKHKQNLVDCRTMLPGDTAKIIIPPMS
jgi:hypothetical protein